MVVSNLYNSYNSIGDAVIITDVKGNITKMNPVAEKITGCSFSNSLGKPLLDVFHVITSKTGKKEEDLNNLILKSRGPLHFNHDTILTLKEGIERKITGSVLPIRKTDNNVAGIVLIFRDLTEQNIPEYENRFLQKMEITGRLAGGIVHDFNNILTGISGCAELLLRKIDKNDSNRKYIDMILGATIEAADLTQKILTFSQKSKMRSDPVDIHGCIKYAVNDLEWNNCKITIREELKANITTITGDSIQIQNVIKNIVLNARDAMKNGGELTLATFNIMLDEEYVKRSSFKLNPGTYIEISVCDTGIGMTKDIQRNIFDPFFSTKNNGKSAGFGLPVVYIIVSEHHGAIHVLSQVNKGTIFKIYMPVDKFT